MSYTLAVRNNTHLGGRATPLARLAPSVETAKEYWLDGDDTVQTIFDIGMYDGADTAYYLESGYQVISVEANPALVEAAKQKFAARMSTGQLTCIHAAISPDGKPVELTVSGTDPGSSTLFGDRIPHKRPLAPITVSGITVESLFNTYGVPLYMKVDIEGADRYCVLSLSTENRPAFLSFEIGDDVHELLAHVAAIGYTRFKIINQNSFREFANIDCLPDRVARKFMRFLGYADPLMVRRAGRFFVVDHSSGPAPWHSDGAWRSFDQTRSIMHNVTLPGWNDIHATME